MNDATNLYLAVKIADTSFAAADLLAFLFDNNNNGVFEEAGDDALGLWASLAAFTDGFVNRPGDVSPDTDHGGTSDGQGRSSASGGFNYFEISHPLDSADDVHDFSLAAGNTVGFYLSYMKASGVYGGMWPFSDPLTSLFTTTITTTTNWAHVTVASAPVEVLTSLEIAFNPLTVDVGAVPSGATAITVKIIPPRDRTG